MKTKEYIHYLVVAGLLSVLLFLSAAQPVGAQAPAPNGPMACTAEPTTFRTTLTAVKDSYLRSTRPTDNYGTATGLMVGLVDLIPDGETTYRTLVAFNLASLPSDAVILTATLELYQTGSAGSSFSMKVQALTGSWTEAGVTWDDQPTYTTADEAGSGTVSGDWRQWHITPIVQKWYTGALANNGVRLIFDLGLKGSRTFSAREGAHPPRLVVEYVRRATLPALADTTISQLAPSTNYGNAMNIVVLRNESTFYESHGLLRFDVSGIPAGSTIISAALGLVPTINRAQVNAPQLAVSLAPEAIVTTWSEMVVTWNSRPGSQAMGDPPTPWTQGLDRNWVDVTAIAQGWASGAVTNYGIKLKIAGSATGSADFGAREGSDPQLIITYGPPPCYAATSVVIGGATQGITDTQYTFDATIAPVTATLPITYTWEATDQTAHAGPQEDVEYTWSTPGWKTITVTVENCESSVMDTHLVSITIPAPTCEFPLTGLGLLGPTQGVTDTSYTFTATLAPAAPTPPYTLTWEADGQTPLSGQQTTAAFTWNAPGAKHITITAENCGGVFVQYHTFTVIPREQLPDLRVTSFWYNLIEHRVYAIVKNTGGSAAPAGFTLVLTKAITEVAQTTFPEVVQPGWVRAGAIDYEWGCAEYPPGTTALRALVTVDSDDGVLEGDETNNTSEEWWLCDPYPPEIIAGPTVASVTEHTAVITWTTDKPVRSYFDYGRNGPFNTATLSNTSYKTEHQVSLSDLSNASAYWYKIRLTDHELLFNATNGDYFETLPPGTDPVTLGAFGITEYPSTLYEFYTLYADVASDVEGVDHVSFFLDQQLIGRDVSPTGSRYEVYVSPAALGLTRAQWFANHTLQVQAYNLENEVTADAKTVTPPARPMPGKALLLTPGSGQQFYVDGSPAPTGTTINSAIYGAQYRWACTSSGYSEGGEVPPGLSAVRCDDVRESVSAMRLYLDGALVGTHTPPANVENYWFTVNLAGKSLGDHTLRFDAQTTAGNTISADEVTFTLVRGQADLEFGRTATRSGNAIQVTLRITNTGTGTAYVDYIEDVVRGFQVIEVTNAPGRLAPAAEYYAVANGDYGETPARLVMIDVLGSGGEGALGAGESFAITYRVVPILYPTAETYSIGSGGAGSPYLPRIHYRHPGGTAHAGFQAGSNLVDGVYVDTVVQQIAAASDYLLVTSPMGLAMYTVPADWRADAGTQRELSLLLSRMAELAALKNGVLGFLPLDPCGATLEALLSPGGHWANALHPNFRGANATGYVLLVGEQEIIPARPANYSLNFSDLPYASTSGNNRPELIVGRLVGDDLGTLRKALDTSLAYHRTGYGFDRSHAIAVSGRGRGESVFWGDVKAVAGIMADGGFAVTKIRWKNDNDPTAWDFFKNKVAEIHPDVILYSGHGNPDSWYAMGSSSIQLLDFGATRPIGLGFACSTGNYEDPGGDDYSLPEAWLRYDGSIYIGSSDTSYDYPDSDALRAFFTRWETGEEFRNVGQVFTYLKRDKWDIDHWWNLWAYEYHLFGDPKFGATPYAQQSVVKQTAPRAPQGSAALAVHIPDFVVSVTEEGLDAVEIPDGELWGEAGEYRVPYWIESVDYAPGQRVQNVTLTAQAGLVVTTGLQLPTTTMEIRCLGCAPLAPTAAVTPTWFPALAQPYRWQITENADGSSTLAVIIYPFSYYSPTTDARFYQDWSFAIDVFTTTVSLTDLQPTQPTYRLTETVAATLVVHNSGAAQPVIVQADIRSGVDETVVAATPLQTLHAITGTSLLDWVITETLPAGSYYLDVTLADMEGHVLDTEVTEFAVGVAEGELTSFTVTPTYFQPGEAVSLAMTFQNIGDVPLDGVAIFRVQSADGVTQTAEFTHTLSALAPGATTTFNDLWTSDGAAADTVYRVVGYVKYAL
ncbi:MAG TPA: DNRLRE domain-containing protein, partial [Anaerolineae bacterium]|nr:DNRLRE domain-containing protein [Anaerolineae bacterium]